MTDDDLSALDELEEQFDSSAGPFVPVLFLAFLLLEICLILFLVKLTPYAWLFFTLSGLIFATDLLFGRGSSDY